MAASPTLLLRFTAESLHGVAVVIDRGLRLHDVALRNAETAVAADRIRARSRAVAQAAVDGAATSPELALVGA